MRLGASVACITLLCAALAGCSEAPAQSEEDQDDLGLDLHADEDTGVLRGVVVDEAIVPLEGVRIVAAREGVEHETVTNRDGAFGIGALEPGTYVVTAEAETFFSQKAIAPVRAGIEDPPIVKFVLERDAESLPYVIPGQFQGYMECGMRGGTGNVQACRIVNDFVGDGTTSDNTRFEMDIDASPAWLQAEMVWTSTQPLGERMGFLIQQYTADGAGSYAGLSPHNQGTSPLILSIDSEGQSHCPECDDTPLNMTVWRQMHFRALAGGLEATEPPVEVCSPTGSPCLEETGVIVGQSFEAFFHVFYRYTPPEGWTFGEDGAYPPP